MKKLVTGLLMVLLGVPIMSQDLPIHIGNQYVYDFLDEIAAAKILDDLPAVRPVSRALIGEILMQADSKRDLLSTRQQKELDQFLIAFQPEIKPNAKLKYFGVKKWSEANTSPFYFFSFFNYQDSNFRFTVSPIVSAQTWISNEDLIFHRRSGLMATATIGKSWAFWASLEDNHETRPLAEDTYLSLHMGGNYKRVDEGVDYSETRGGISYAWSWGSLSLVKDHLSWGSGYHGSMIFSGRSPSFAMLKLKMNPVKWLEFNYFHGYLISEVIDSSRTAWYTNAYGTDRREYYHGKYVAANLFTLKPWPRLNFSFGNSIIYNELVPNPMYFVPFLFYKSGDHTLSGAGSNRVGQNAQMFFDISSWQIKGLHLYGSLFIDEISLKRMFKPKEQSNFFSMKAGLAWYGLPLSNSRFIAEYSRSNPLVYEHYSPVTTFESNQYNLGYYLGDNADEIYLAFRWSPLAGGSLEASYSKARKGTDYTALGAGRIGLPFMAEEQWSAEVFKVAASYRIMYHIKVFASISLEETKGDKLTLYTPQFFHGEHWILHTGFHWNY